MMRRARWVDEQDDSGVLTVSRLRFGEYLLSLRPEGEGIGSSWRASSPAINVHDVEIRGPLSLEDAQQRAIDLVHAHLKNLLAQFERAALIERKV